MEMLTAYLVALSFGAVLLGAGMLFGGGDHDTDHDLDADHDFLLDRDDLVKLCNYTLTYRIVDR